MNQEQFTAWLVIRMIEKLEQRGYSAGDICEILDLMGY